MRNRTHAGMAAVAVVAAWVLAASTAARAALQVVDIHAASGDTVATVSFDGGTAFGSTTTTFASGNLHGFALAVPSAVGSTGGTAVFDLPDITISAAAGWTLSDPRTFLGNLSFAEAGGAVASAHLAAVLHISGWPSIPISTDMYRTVTASVPQQSRQGYFSTLVAMPGPFTSTGLSDGVLTLAATPGGSSVAAGAQLPSELRFTFLAAAVPEPASWMTLLAGLLPVSWALRRRHRR